MPFATTGLALHDVAIERGGRILSRGVSFAANGGDIIEIRGPNGSGKTTLLRTIAGFRRPAAGRVEAAPEALHFVGHGNAAKAALSVAAHVRFWSALFNPRNPPAAILEQVGLTPLASLPVRALSQGQARRLALARLLAAPRPIWLLDEPAAGLDQAGVDLLGTMLDAHRRSGGVTIVALHDAQPISPTRTIRLGAA